MRGTILTAVNPWLLRALVMVPLHAAVAIGVEVAAVRWPEEGGWLRVVALVVLVVAALVWGTWDGTRAARSWDDPAARWLKAGLLTGPVAGLVVLLVRAGLLDATGMESASAALTGGAAFTALLVLLPAVVGLLLGRWLVAPPKARRAGADDAGPDEEPGDDAPADDAPDADEVDGTDEDAPFRRPAEV